MQRLQCMAIASLAYLAVGGNAGSVRQEPTHLRTVADSDAPWKAAIEVSISNFALPAPMSTVSAKTSNAGKGDKGDKGDKVKKTDQPVSVQIAENDMANFMGLLSKECSHRFEQMLHGKGTGLHTFGTAGSKADGATCKKLDGTLCATQAHIIHAKQNANGRKMESTTDVSGNSCLPSQCMSKTDLTQLSQFMHGQAKGIIPGDAHRIELNVDCTKNGGTTAAIGVKSGSTFLVPTALTIVLAMGNLAAHM